MKGYKSLKQFVEDYGLYITAKKVDPGKEGETITSYLKKRIKQRLSTASKNFKATIKKQNYSMDDLKIIATHDSMEHIMDFESFVKECFALDYVTQKHYKRLLSSRAFRNGRLRRLYEFVPLQIRTKTQLFNFIRSRRGISKSELEAIMNHLCKNDWKQWLNELIDKKSVGEDHGRWFA